MTELGNSRLQLMSMPETSNALEEEQHLPKQNPSHRTQNKAAHITKSSLSTPCNQAKNAFLLGIVNSSFGTAIEDQLKMENPSLKHIETIGSTFYVHSTVEIGSLKVGNVVIPMRCLGDYQCVDELVSLLHGNFNAESSPPESPFG